MHESIWSDLTGVEFCQGFQDVEGVRTRYLSCGSHERPLLLFLHGTGGHAEAYTRNLAAHGRHFWTVAIDMVGHGWTDKPLIDYEIPAYAHHVIGFLKSVNRPRAHISGESLGGWVATYLAIHHPHCVDRLVLNTAGGWTAHPDVMQRIVRLSTEAVRDPTPERLRARLEFLMYDKRSVNEDLVETRRRIYSQPGYVDVTERILCLQDMPTRRRNMFTRDQYSKITSPTLVVWTSHDPTATVEEGRELASLIPGSCFVVIDECGHWPQFEKAEEFNRIQLEFLLRGHPNA
jgi:2-hydroxy-6-oxonona-2,4-dienedioate hydrolase